MLGPRRFGRPLALLAFVSILALVASGSQRQTAGVAPLQHLRTRRPSHERLRCLTDAQWRCNYDTVPEPDLGFSNPNVIGSFVGTDVTSTWACPKGHWFPADICDSATRVISGVQTFIQPGRGELFSVNAEYVVTDDGILWNYWPDLSLICPWYPTFGQALTSPAECIFRHA